MTLAVIGVLGMGAIKFYKHTVNKVKAQNTAKMIKTLAFERQNMALRQESNLETTVKGPHSSLHVKNGTSGNHHSYFWVETTLSDKDFCDSLKDSGFIQAEFVEVDGVADGNCRDHSKLAFYFKKNPNAQVYCPSHSTNCDTYGDATGCEEGYYLAGGVCESCGEHVATCEDENTPLSCVDGYALYGSICSDLPSCTFDLDCDVCGECSQEGYCTQTCSIPEPDQNNSCGKNECMVYDNATLSCQNACERKDYLESTGTQYIDTGFALDSKKKISVGFSTSTNQDTKVPMGVYDGTNWTYLVYTYGANGLVTFNNSTQNTLGSFNLNIHKLVIDYANLLYNYDGVSTSLLGIPRDYTLNLFLFGRNNKGKADAFFNGLKIYYFKYYENEELIRDFIPVLSPSGEPAFFDRVEQKLYYNAGTGSFDYGPK